MKRFFILLFSLLLLSGVVLSASAKTYNPNASLNGQIPEVSGDYSDPDHPGVRVRVFVHEPKAKGRPQVDTQAVCDDPESSSVDQATNWKLPSTNWTYRLNKSSVPSSVGSGNLETIAKNGFDAWTTSISSTSKPTLNYGGTTSVNRSRYDGQNIISWGRTSGSALGVTYVRYYTSSGLVVDVDTIMNQKFPWTLNTCSANAYDAGDILTHEQGHWFGLDDHYSSDFEDNTMYGYGSKGETKKVTPENGDKAGINLIYP
jgi:hypothetical protein